MIKDIIVILLFGAYKKKVQNMKRNRRGGVSPPAVRVGKPNPPGLGTDYENSVAVTRFLNMSLLFCIVLLSILGCGEEGLIDPHGEVELSPLSNEGFQAADFPTNNGSAWTYRNVGFGLYNAGQEEAIQALLEETFTIRIEGTRDISGLTHRQATVSEIKAIVRTDRGDEERVFRAPVDHLSANARYYRIDSDFLDVDLPLYATYFHNTPQTYTESAFDVYVFFLDNPVLHQKHFPPRLIWDFPLQIGKEWTVFETKTSPPHRVVRRVVDANVSITVPAGSYNNAYLVEEEIVGLSQLPALKVSDDFETLENARYEPAKYWVVPNLGVVKYQYTYLLTERELTDGVFVNLLFSGDFELSDFDLPDDSLR